MATVHQELARDRTRDDARRLIAALRGLGTETDVQDAKALIDALCKQRDFALMGELAEQVCRRDMNDATVRRQYGQCLIEMGYATAAADVLQALLKKFPGNAPEVLEATGLLGRANKQIFCDAGDKSTDGAHDALKKAVGWYRKPWDTCRSTWHGVNLAALVSRARMIGVHLPKDLDVRAITAQLIVELEKTPIEKRDTWYFATLAEASLGLGNWNAAEAHMNTYVTLPDVKAFHIASTLRQFTEVWDIERTDARGRALVDVLRARLMRLEAASLALAPDQVKTLQSAPPPGTAQLEAVLGRDGPQTYAWWKTGLSRALSVASIRQLLGSRIGTGFLVRAGDVGCEPPDELMVLTNYHVVNDEGALNGVRPGEAEVVFEAVDATKAYAIKKIEWSSPPDVMDASLLRLSEPVTGVLPLPIGPVLPVLEESARVYVIGYPGGRDLAFSFQDNELLDHEGAPQGHPPNPNAVRLHYRTPTEGGSSGSPVFNSRLWQVIALHHKGGKLGMPMLNGKPGTYGANEGIAIQSIVAAVKAQAAAAIANS